MILPTHSLLPSRMSLLSVMHKAVGCRWPSMAAMAPWQSQSLAFSFAATPTRPVLYSVSPSTPSVYRFASAASMVSFNFSWSTSISLPLAWPSSKPPPIPTFFQWTNRNRHPTTQPCAGVQWESAPLSVIASIFILSNLQIEEFRTDLNGSNLTGKPAVSAKRTPHSSLLFAEQKPRAKDPVLGSYRFRKPRADSPVGRLLSSKRWRN